MKKTKFFLAQFLIEVDVTERPDFDDIQASDYFSSVFQLSGNDKKIEVKVYPLAAKPDSRQDVEIETYEYRGYRIEVCQNAHTVGSDRPTYFGVVFNLQAKHQTGSVLGSEQENIEEVKQMVQEYVDKKIARMEKRGLSKQ